MGSGPRTGSEAYFCETTKFCERTGELSKSSADVATAAAPTDISTWKGPSTKQTKQNGQKKLGCLWGEAKTLSDVYPMVL